MTKDNKSKLRRLLELHVLFETEELGIFDKKEADEYISLTTEMFNLVGRK